MKTIMPTAGTPFKFSETARGILGLFEKSEVIEKYQKILRSYLKVDNLLLVNSGTTACFLLLQLFKRIRKSSEQTEVILSAYTAPSLLLPIRAAGLEAVIVDIDPVTFNMDISKVKNVISGKTLAIMPIHMFGIPMEVEPILDIVKNEDIFVFEDAASSLGSKIEGKQSGTIAPFGFYSMNRGKNISTLAGGIVAWEDNEYSEILKDLVKELPCLSPLSQTIMMGKMIGLSLAVRPLFYTLLSAILSKYKYTELHTDFDSFQFTGMQAALGVKLWKRAAYFSHRRVENGQALLRIFQNIEGITIPKIPKNSEAAFNQFPILIKDLQLREKLEKALYKQGFETSRMYERALYQIYPELNRDGVISYSNAKYLAEHLLLFPPHTQINTGIINRIRRLVYSIF